MSEEFQFDALLSHSSKDKGVVRDMAARLKKDGIRVWLDEEQIRPGDSIPAKIEDGLERSRVLVLCMSENAFASDWAQLEAGTFRFRDPLNKGRRFIPLRLDAAPIKGSLAQFYYINWLPTERDREYVKLLEACRPPEHPATSVGSPAEERFAIALKPNQDQLSGVNDYVQRRRDVIQQVLLAFEPIHALFFKICIDYLSLVEVLHAGLKATDVDRTKYYEYIKQIGLKLHEMHLLEGRLAVIGADVAVRAMQQYRLQATEVNDMVRLQLPCKEKTEVSVVTDELFQRKDRLYEEMAKALRESGADKVEPPPNSPQRKVPLGDAWSGLRGILQEEYSTQIIKGILGKAGLPASKIEYRGTFKGPVLDEADKLVALLTNQDRDRFVVACIEEIIAFERKKTVNLAERGIKSDGKTIRELRRVLDRFGHDLDEFKPGTESEQQ